MTGLQAMAPPIALTIGGSGSGGGAGIQAGSQDVRGICNCYHQS